ncbi:MAG TPA: hypothetical protein VML35_09715 [Gaiellaceae bacterium]|nr:hypothetical protein [Gaiellaceae bacterium]
MRNRKKPQPPEAVDREAAAAPELPRPSTSFRRRAWLEFQRALDPLAPVKPLPRPRL